MDDEIYLKQCTSISKSRITTSHCTLTDIKNPDKSNTTTILPLNALKIYYLKVKHAHKQPVSFARLGSFHLFLCLNTPPPVTVSQHNGRPALRELMAHCTNSGCIIRNQYDLS